MPKAVAKVDPAKEAAKAAAKVEKACNDLVKACKDDALSKAKKAVESGAEIDHDATGTGSTPMHIAAGFGSYDVVNYLYSVKPDSIEKKNGKEKTPLDVAMQVGEDKIVRLLKALLRGEAPPQEAADAGDDDDDEDEDEAYPVNETSTGAKQAAPPQKAEVLVQAAEAVQAAELASKLKSLSFSTAGKLGISLEKNVVAKVGEAGTQAADQGVQAGWVLFSIAGTEVEADKAAIMKQASAALKLTPAGVEFCFQVPPAPPPAAVEID